jgi:hypothetical protein
MKFATMVFRATVTIHVVLLLTQPILIGLFLSGGDRSKLQAHEMGGSAVGATGLLLVIASIVAWRVAHWSARVVMWCLGLVVAETFQLTMGYDRHLGIHVPLGVLLAVMASFLYSWAYKPQPPVLRTRNRKS